jgi:hypothetical protein
LDAGENLLIIEVDGPHEQSLPYSKEIYRVSNDFLEKVTMLTTKENAPTTLNDKKHPFGHSYCLASALLDINLFNYVIIFGLKSIYRILFRNKNQ